MRQWRLWRAREQEIRPYVIFHGSVLRDIARGNPVSHQELAGIKDVGTSKLDRYGESVLAVIKEISAKIMA